MKMNKLVRKRIFAAALSAAMVTTAMPEAAIAETSSDSGNSTTYTDEAYIDVLSKVVTVDSVAVEAETDINKYGLGTVSANLSSSSGDEVTNTSITWSSSNTNVIKFFDSDNNAFVDTLTTENADSVQFYGVGSGTATITATSGDGPEATTETITVEDSKAEWNATVAGVLVNTDTQSGKVGAMNGMVIDTMTNNKVNSKTGKCGMKKGAAKGMQIRNTILSVPVTEDAKIKVKLFQAPSTVVTSNDGSYNWEGLVADGTKVTWDAEECAYTVGFDYDTMAVAGSDMQVSTSDITTGDGSVTSFADSYAQLTFGSSDVYVTSITVETGDGISYSYTAADSYDADIAFAETDDVTLDLNGTTTVSRAASVTGDDAASVTAVYSSSNSDIAEVDSEGNVTAKAVGYTTITAKIPADTDSSSFKTATYDVYVKDTSDVADSYNVKLNTVVTPQTNGTYDFGIVKGTGCYWNDSTHGWCFYKDSTLTFHVNGASTITVGGCQYGAAGTMTLSDGTTSLEGDYSTDCSGSTSFDWTTDEAADLTLTFSGSKAYVPYIIVKSAEEAASSEIATKWTAAEFAEQAVTAYEGNCGDFNGLYIDATKGKFAKNSSDWIQINAGTVLYVPITADGTLTIETYYAASTYTAGASETKMTESSAGKVYTYDVDYDTDAVSVDGYDVKFVKVTAGNNDYISTISMDYGTEDSQSENEKSTEEATEESTEEASTEASEESTEEASTEASEESTEEASTEASEESTEEASTEASEESTEEAESETTTDSWTLKGNSAVESLNGAISEDITLAGDSGNLNLTLSAEGTGVGTSVKNATKFVNHSSGLKIKNDALMISGVTGNVELTINYKNTGTSARNLEVTVGADGTTEDYALEASEEGTYTTTIDADDTNIYIGASNEIAIASITIAEVEEEEETTLTTQSVASAVKSAVSSVLGFFGLSGSDEEDTSLETASVDGVTDAYIALDFDSAPEVTESSTLAAHIFNASTGEEVDTVYSNEGEKAADATYYTGSSSIAGGVGKIAVKDNLIAVEDNTLVITPHNDENGYPVLENGTEYYVTLDEGLVSGTLKGTTISSIDDKSTFTFKTSDTTEITDGTIDVNHDGSGDFYTINGALNYLRKAEATGSWAINVAEGNYHERLFYYGDADITLDGADADLGAKVQVDWKNADDYGSGGARSRSTLLVQGTGDMVIRDMSFTNSYSRINDGDDGSTQAETLCFDSSGELIAYNSSFYSHQDTLYIGKKGTRAWFYNDYIEGDVDYIWGYADVALFENCKLKCVADEKNQSYIFASRTYTDSEANKGFVLMNSEIEIPSGMTAAYARNSGSDTQASIINNTFTGEGSLTTALYGSAPNSYTVDAAGDLAVGYKDYNNTMNGTLVDTSSRLDKCGEMTERVANREYNGRYVILNRGYDETDEKYETASELWDISAYETEFGASEDVSEGNIFIEPVAVKKLVGGNKATLTASDINGKDITDKVTWSYTEENAGIVTSADKGVFETAAGANGRITVTATYNGSAASADDSTESGSTESGSSSESTDSSSESTESTDSSSEATDSTDSSSESTDSSDESTVSDDEATDDTVADDTDAEAESVSYNGRSCLADGTVLDSVKVANNAVNGYMVSQNVVVGNLEMSVNYYDGMAYRNGATVPTVVALNGKVVYEDGNLLKNVEITDGIVVKSVKFLNNRGAYLNDDATYQFKSGKAPQIVVKVAAKDKSVKSVARAMNKVLRNSEAMRYEIEPVDVQEVLNGSSIYSGYSFSLKNTKVRFTMPKYKQGALVSGKTTTKTIKSKDYTINDNGSYNFMRNFKGVSITVK